MKYWFCYYHIIGRHVNYHHVIIKAELEDIIDVIYDEYTYYIREITEMELTEKDTELKYIQALIRDGESLLKKIKINKVKNKNESIRL